VADSNGKKVKLLDLVRELSKLKTRVQQLSRKKKNSSNRAKAKAKIAKQNLRKAITNPFCEIFYYLDLC